MGKGARGLERFFGASEAREIFSSLDRTSPSGPHGFVNRGAAQSGRRRTHLHLKESGDNEAPPPSHTSAPESNHVKNMTRDVLIRKDSRVEGVTMVQPVEDGKKIIFYKSFDVLIRRIKDGIFYLN